MFFRVADWLKAITLVLIIYATYAIARTITHTIFLFVVAALVTFVITFIIAFLTSKEVNRSIAIVLTFTVTLGLISILVFAIGPVILNQISSFLADIPEFIDSLKRFSLRIQRYIERIRLFEILPFNPGTLINQLVTIVTEQLRSIILLIPSLIALTTDLILIFFISVYALFYLPEIDNSIRKNLPSETSHIYEKFLSTMKTALGRYLLGQLGLMTVVGILSGLGVWLVGLPFPVLFGLWAGLTEIIPILGPILGAIPAVIVALTIKPILALWVAIIFIAVQQLEGSVLSPLIFRSAVGLNPLLVLFTIIAGAEIAGIIGIFLAVPILVVIFTVISFIMNNFKYERTEDGPDKVVVKHNTIQ